MDVDSITNQTMPVPIPDLDSAPFWEAAARGELVLQQCADCKAYRYPPGPICPECNSFETVWQKATGNGTVYSWIVAHHPVHPLVQDKVPYVVALVELDEGPRMVTRLVDVPIDEVEADLAVEVAFESIADQVQLPHFRPRR